MGGLRAKKFPWAIVDNLFLLLLITPDGFVKFYAHCNSQLIFLSASSYFRFLYICFIRIGRKCEFNHYKCIKITVDIMEHSENK